MQHSCPEHDHNDQLVLDSKQAVWVVSGLLLVIFFVFMAGYFFGKRQALEQFSHALDQESIADKIYSSLYASYEGKTGSDAVEADNAPHKTEEADAPEIVESTPDTTVAQVDTQPTTMYYAPLIGFGSEKVAQKYADRLIKQGFVVAVKQRTSTTAKGRVTTWYQVVTRSYTCRDELAAVIAILKQREHLKGVHILTT